MLAAVLGRKLLSCLSKYNTRRHFGSIDKDGSNNNHQHQYHDSDWEDKGAHGLFYLQVSYYAFPHASLRDD